MFTEFIGFTSKIKNRIPEKMRNNRNTDLLMAKRLVLRGLDCRVPTEQRAEVGISRDENRKVASM